MRRPLALGLTLNQQPDSLTHETTRASRESACWFTFRESGCWFTFTHADFGEATHPGVGGGTHRRRATVERC